MENDTQNQQVSQPPETSPSTPDPAPPVPKRKLPFILGGLVLLLIVGSGAYILGTQRNAKPLLSQRVATSLTQVVTPTPTSSSSTSPSHVTWKTYSNTKYGYQVNYPTDQNYVEQDTATYGHTNFLAGCFNVYAVPQRNVLPLSLEVTSQQISELESLQEGSTKTYSTPNWGGQKDFTYKVDYKKLPSKTISDISWSSFDIINNFENHTVHNMYFTNKSNYLYLIDMQSSGPCYEDEPIQMLNTFKFTN